jgi:hypothetical protein
MAKTNYSPTFPMFPGDATDLSPSDTDTFTPSVIYTGGGGSVKVTTAQGSDVTFTGLPPGAIIPVQVIRVYSTGTSTSGLLRIF